MASLHRFVIEVSVRDEALAGGKYQDGMPPPDRWDARDLTAAIRMFPGNPVAQIESIEDYTKLPGEAPDG